MEGRSVARPLRLQKRRKLPCGALLLEGGQRVKSFSIGFLADFEEAWRKHGKKVLQVLVEKNPTAFFGGAVALSKVVKWDQADTAMFDQTLTPEQIMDKLEQRVGPEGRKLFERFLRDVNKLQAKRIEAQQVREEE